MLRQATLALVVLPLISLAAHAELAVSAQDGKQVLVDGVPTVPDSPVADYVAIFDLGSNPPKLMAEVPAPTSVVGPPQSVAVAPDESFALVTSANAIDPADPKKVTLNDKLTVIDLQSSPPQATATLTAGKGAAGVSINRAGKLALVANRSEGTVSVFTIDGKTLTPAGKIELGDDKSGPSHVVFSPDGKTALVSRDGDSKISVLSVDGGKVTYAKRDLSAGVRPYSIEMSARGRGRRQRRDRERRCRYGEYHRSQSVARPRGRHTDGGADAGRRAYFAGWEICRLHRGERVEQAQILAVLQRQRPREDLCHQRYQAHGGDRGKDRPLVPGRCLEQDRDHAHGSMHGRARAAGVWL